VVEVNSALIGYAVLKANYDASAPTYIESFGGFVLAAMAAQESRYVQRNQIARYLSAEFGLRIPDLVIGRMLKKLRRSESVVQVSPEAHQLTEKGAAEAPTVTEQAVRFEREQAELALHFKDFVDREFPSHAALLDESESDALARYFDRNAVPILKQSLHGKSAGKESEEAGINYLISRFVTHLAATDQVRFGYVEDASKGAVLASVLTLDTLGFAESMSKVQLFFDTPVILNALGLHGGVFENSSQQLLSLAREQGATLAVFEHSLKEVDGILDSAEHSLRMPNSKSTNAVYLHMVESGMSASDLAVVRRQVPALLRDLAIRIVEKPDSYKQFGLDEAGLETKLQEKVRYMQSAARLYDVDSLSAVHRLRRGSTTRHLEECAAVLVTSNTGVVRAANEFSSERHPFPLAITEEALAGLLWVRSPTASEAATRQQLVATAYAGMQPNGSLWSKYLAEVDKLEKRAEISPDEAIILRSTSTGREALMEETLGDPEEVTPDAPLAVLKRVREQLVQPLEEELDLAKLRQSQVSTSAQEVKDLLEASRSELRRLQEERDRADASRRARGRRWATRVVRGPLFAFAAAAVAAAVLSLLGVALPGQAAFPLVVAAVVLVALSAVRQFIPGTLLDWLRPIEERLAVHRYRRLSLAAGFEPTPLREGGSVAGSRTEL
jgi:hypothetical protein